MGSDFIEKATPTFTKCWDAGKLALAEADLFTKLPSAKSRSFAADVSKQGALKKGDKITVEKIDKTLVATRGHTELARCTEASEELLEAIGASRGIAQGEVTEVHDAAGIAEISICLPRPE
jgi:hypothetical protein